MERLIDADALFAVVKGHHDLYKGATNPADKARRDECLQVMCDINDAPTIDAIPVAWLREKIKEHTDEEGWQDYLANSFGLCIEEWQKEQEAQK